MGIHTRRTRALWEQSPPSLQHRLRSPSVQAPPIPSTPSVVVFRCSPKNPQRNTSTRELGTASRRLRRKRAWHLACTKVSWPTFSAVLVALWFWSSTIGPKPILGSNAITAIPYTQLQKGTSHRPNGRHCTSGVVVCPHVVVRVVTFWNRAGS